MITRTLLSLLFFLPVSEAVAGNWHTAGSLRCADCHQQHESGQPGEGPFSYLLVKNSVNELCLSCHDGSVSNAPDVQYPVTMYSSTLSGESCAGSFGMAGQDNPNGHNLGILTSTPLRTSGLPQELTCASCHAVHGNGNYRNLLTDPAGVGDSLRVEIGIDIMVGRMPDDPPTTGGAAAAYEKDNAGYVSGLTQWCSSCHDQLKTNGSAAAPAHFNGHPNDVALNQFGYQPHSDAKHWVQGQGDGFPSSAPAGIARVPVLSPTATSFVASRTPQETDQVSCMSCHKAHGSSNKKGMLWPYLEGGPTFNAGCQQCHNK